MIQNNEWSKIFLKSSFYCINKEEDLSDELKLLQSKISYDKAIDGFHPNRKNEFLLGRVCAAQAYQACTKKELLDLPPNKDRSPAWPNDVVGTISHNQSWVGAAVALKKDLLAIGMDFEVMGRTRAALSSQIRSPGDILTHPKFNEEELLTLIFSCKESLYKALHPVVKIFFGFEDAAVKKIDVENGLFEIVLLTTLSPAYGPDARHFFKGRFTIYNNSCLTVLEISEL
jgi:4'-phosphopantetheinyl transferase EntD